MDQAAFRQSCERDGFEAVEERQGKAGFSTKLHTHPFSARIMVTSGEFSLTRNGATEVYTEGANFDVQAGCEHAEAFGAEGSTYLAARKHDAAPG